MHERVAVVSPLPLVRRGLADELRQTGFRPDQPDSLRSWISLPDHRVVVLAVESPSELGLVGELLRWRPDAVVIVLVAHADETMHLQAVRAGAAGIADWDTSIDEVTAMIAAGLCDRTSFPTDVARSLFGRTPPVRSALPETDRELLRGLAAGESVAKMGTRIGYSERETFRRLHRLYRRMGVDARGPALVRAARWGLID